MKKNNNLLKGIGIAVAIIVLVPVLKLAAALAVAFMAGIVALIVAEPLISIPVVLIFGLIALVDYGIVRGLIRAFKR